MYKKSYTKKVFVKKKSIFCGKDWRGAARLYNLRLLRKQPTPRVLVERSEALKNSVSKSEICDESLFLRNVMKQKPPE